MQIGKGKQGVRIGEYSGVEDGNGVLGWIEPNCDSPDWILWFTVKGDGLLYTEREPNGGVSGEPLTIPAKKNKPKFPDNGKPIKISKRDIESMLGILNHRPEETETSCTFNKYSLVASRTPTGVSISWFKKNTRDPIQADGFR